MDRRGITQKLPVLLGASLTFILMPQIAMAGGAALHGHVPEIISRLQLAPQARLEGTNRMELAVSLPLRNQAELARLLRQLYDPASPNYRHVLTPEQFVEKFGPPEKDYAALIAFAGTNGLEITRQHSNRMLLDVRASAAEVERALHLRLWKYRHPAENRWFFAPDREPAPDISVPVLHIAGLDNLSTPRPMLHHAPPKPTGFGGSPVTGSGTGLGGAYFGPDFRAAYMPGVALTGQGQTVGLIQFGSGFIPGDITNFEAQAGLGAVPVTAVLIDGYDGSPGIANDEVSIDIEMAISMAPGLDQVLVYETPDTSSQAPTDDMLNRIATDDSAKQISASWGYSTDATDDQIFQEFAAQGQSFFNASGDGDAWVGPVPYGSCEDSNITIVGGTTLSTSGPAGAWVAETVWNWGQRGAANAWNPDGYVGDGGGVSADVLIPAWQQGISMSVNGGSTLYRNLPDVALTADNIFVFFGGGSSGAFGGTSCASPLWAGVTALINEQAAAGGRSTIGFLNPSVYALGQESAYTSCFHDITNGNNAWDKSPNNYFAAPGYDLCTGWGTPAGAELLAALARPDDLRIYPVVGFYAYGQLGGPYRPVSQTLILTNAGTNVITWTVSDPVPWLAVSATGGQLGPGSTQVTVSLAPAYTNLPAGLYTTNIVFEDANNAVTFSRRYTLDVLAAPAIDTQPANASVFYGAPATFSVSASGGQPLSYRWWFGGAALTDGTNVSGSGSSLLTISNVSPPFAGSYYVTVSNPVLSITSSNVSLSITPSAPVLFRQPGDELAIAGGSAYLTVAAYGDPPYAYQWAFNQTNLPFGTNQTLSVTNLQYSQAGNYTVTVSNPRGSTLSSNALLTVVPGIVDVATFDDFNLGQWDYVAPPVGYDGLTWSNLDVLNAVLMTPLPPPGGSTDRRGTARVWAGLTSTNSGYQAGVISLSNVLYNAYGNPASLSRGTPFNLVSVYATAAWNDNLTLEAQGYLGAARIYDSTYLLSATAPTNILLNFIGVTSVEFVSSGGSPHPRYSNFGTQFVMDNLVVVEPSGPPINLAPAIYDFGPANVLISMGADTNLAAAAVGQPPLAYQWLLNGTNLIGATNTTLPLLDVQPSMTGSYTVVITNLYGCTTSSAASVTVISAPLITAQPQDEVVNLGQSATLNVSALGAAPLTYCWQFQGGTIPGATNASFDVARTSLADSGAYGVIVSNSYGAATSRLALLTVLPAPGIGSYGSQPLVFFPSYATNQYVLQITTDPSSGNWVTVSNETAFGGLQITNGPVTAYFRLGVGAQTVTHVSTSGGFAMLVRSDGSLWAAGANVDGALGDGTTDNTNRFEQVVASNVVAVCSGACDLFTKNDGSLWGTGYNLEGQLGNGATYNSYFPVEVGSNVTAFAAGAATLFVKTDGSLWGVGRNVEGELGDGSTNDVFYPEQILPGGVADCAASALNSQSFFIKTNGSLWAMGYNADGELGDGATNNALRPRQIVASGVSAVSAGQFHTAFCKTDGSLWAMGRNTLGQLGIGYASNQSNYPLQVPASNVVAVACGGYHTLFLKRDGSLWAMGRNFEGQLGDGGATGLAPQPELIVASNVVAIAAGEFNSMFVTSDGSCWGMGDNSSGEFGMGGNYSPSLPEKLLAVPSVASPFIAAGTYGGQPVVLYPLVAPPANPPVPVTAINSALQMTTNLLLENWTPVNGGVSFSGWAITNAPGPLYFRLYKPGG